jgi:hypothetical protein
MSFFSSFQPVRDATPYDASRCFAFIAVRAGPRTVDTTTVHRGANNGQLLRDDDVHDDFYDIR